MNIIEMHADFQIKKDRVASLAKQDFEKEEIDWFLNEAQNIFIKQRSDINNLYKKGFETSSKRWEDLSTMMVKYPEQDRLVPDQVNSSLYELPLSKLLYPHYKLVKVRASLDPDCTVWVTANPVQHDDENEALKDPFQKPYKFDEILYQLGKSSGENNRSIYLHTDGIEATQVEVEYLREPVPVAFSKYEHVDGTFRQPQDCLFPPHTHPEIVDIAVQVASLATEDRNTQSQTFKTRIHE